MPTTAIDYREQLLKVINGLSPQELEKIYQVVVFFKEEFIAPDEARYYTPGWLQAEKEATEAYARGGLPRFRNVRELVKHIEAETNETAE
jgi:hypothetical protein